jgi:hypothetical protein
VCVGDDLADPAVDAVTQRTQEPGPQRVVLPVTDVDTEHLASGGGLYLRNDRHLDVLNGARAVIERIDIDHQTIHCRADDHRALTLPFGYAADGHLAHTYAMTVHKTQGATFDRCFVLAGDQLTKESAYTALSRPATAPTCTSGPMIRTRPRPT